MSEQQQHHRHHIEMNEIDDKKKKSLKLRIIYALIIIGTGAPCVILGGWFWFVFVFLLLLFAVHEMLNAPGKKRYGWFVSLVAYVVVISFVYWGMIKSNVRAAISANEAGKEYVFSLEAYWTSLDISVYGIAVMLGIYFWVAIAKEGFTIHDIAYLTMMSLLLGIGFQSIIFVRFFPIEYCVRNNIAGVTEPLYKYWGSWVFILFVLGTTMFADTWAYFIGLLFGKHKMNPRVSPNKTWEGFFGGWILGGLTGLGIAMICDGIGFPILPNLKIFGTNTQWWWVPIMAFCIPPISVLGDLTFSFIKREFGIKDFGTIFGPHGGVLDRFDSHMFCCIFAAIFVIFTSGGWNFFA